MPSLISSPSPSSPLAACGLCVVLMSVAALGSHPSTASRATSTTFATSATTPSEISKKFSAATQALQEGQTQTIDVNQADAQTLRLLPGIGPVLADRILHAREEQPFQHIQDLTRVQGIGARSLERLRPHIHVVPDSK